MNDLKISNTITSSIIRNNLELKFIATIIAPNPRLQFKARNI